ncbi:fatty-acid amide hydrolase 2-B-like [Choristoneura fumiferana]|uniref:fatty-acid amide hydrolase 2-B-like n=1 Tax=Choristoneura fumiferana TaxID=7141 RepID=UPI003D158119
MATNKINEKRVEHNKSKKTAKILKGMACNIFKHVFFFIRTYVELIIDMIFAFIWDGERQAVPDLEARHGILTESAVELARRIRNKTLKSEELVRACVERIQAVNPVLNAVVDQRFEEALKEAQEIDKQIQSGLPDKYFEERPFLGVPFTAKDSHAVRGLVHSLGIAARAHVRASDDAECVRLLRAAGALPVAVTNVPEINKWQESRSMVIGQTRNPYHTGRTVGGSSGGEGALHAALASPISLCSDIGGSTRMPAFYCGLFALNPTAGHTSLKGSALRSGLDPTMASIGFMSKHPEDLAPLTKVVAGDKAKHLNLDRVVDLKNVKVYYVESAQDLRVSPVSKELREAMNKVVAKLSAEGRATASLPQPYYHAGFDHMFALWKHAMTNETEDFPRMLTDNKGVAHGLTELGKKLIGTSQYTIAAILKLLDEQVLPPVNAAWAEKLTASMVDELTTVLGDSGVLLFPSAPAVAPYHYSLLLRPFNFAYWGVLNALKFPAAQVPLGLNPDGIPLGIQVVAAPRQDALCLAVAQHLNEHFGGYRPPCTILH